MSGCLSSAMVNAIVVKPTPCLNGPVRVGTFLRFIDPRNADSFCDPGQRKSLDANRFV